MRRLICAPMLTLLLAGRCFAADAASPPSTAAAAAAAAPAQPQPSSARLKAAAELLSFMNVEAQLNGTVGAMVDTMTQNQPKLADYHDVLVDWAASFMTWNNFGPRITAIYAEAFTESELHDLLAFYRTPTGQKALSIFPALTQKGMQLGVDLAREHAPDLEQRLRARTAELAAPPTAAAPAKPATSGGP